MAQLLQQLHSYTNLNLFSFSEISLVLNGTQNLVNPQFLVCGMLFVVKYKVPTSLHIEIRKYLPIVLGLPPALLDQAYHHKNISYFFPPFVSQKVPLSTSPTSSVDFLYHHFCHKLSHYDVYPCPNQSNHSQTAST